MKNTQGSEQGINAKEVVRTVHVKPYTRFFGSIHYSDERKRPFPNNKYNTELQVTIINRNRNQVDEEQTIIQVGKTHGRSRVEAVSNKQVIWGEGVEVYGCRDYKGVVMTDLHAEIHPSYPDGVMIHGLMDHHCLPRIFKASEVLRHLGIMTERPRNVFQLEEAIFVDEQGNEEKVPINQLKRRVLEKIQKNKDSSLNQDQKKYWQDLYTRAERYIDASWFVVVERDLQVPERLSDVGAATTKEDFEEIYAPIVTWLNVVYSSVKTENNAGGKWDTSDKSVEFYFSKGLPTIMGVYLAHLHGAHIVHGFCHNQNWSAIGSIYDLDSVEGKPIYDGDPEPTKFKYNRDFYDTLDAIIDTFNPNSYLGKKFTGITETAIISFVTGYITTFMEISKKQITEEQFNQLKAFIIPDNKSTMSIQITEHDWEKIRSKVFERN